MIPVLNPSLSNDMILLLILVFLGSELVIPEAVPHAFQPGSPQAPVEWCCTFSSSVCDWSPAYTTNGWYWSNAVQPPAGTIPPSGDNGYVWVIDQTAELSSPVLTDITEVSTFSFNYYLASESSNSLKFSFVNSAGHTTIQGYATPTPGWITAILGCTGSCCLGAPSPCTGKVYVNSIYEPGATLHAAINTVSIDGACI